MVIKKTLLFVLHNIQSLFICCTKLLFKIKWHLRGYGIGPLSVALPCPQNFYCCLFTTGTGDLYTWGKGGPRLGYESESKKVILPRLVEGLEEHRVTDVACGLAHTLGEQACSFLSNELLVSHCSGSFNL